VNVLQILAILLCLVGFHGIFFYSNLAWKTFGWGLFQSGLALFLWVLGPAALPRVLVFLILGVTLAVGMTLTLLCRKIRKQSKTLDGRVLAKRVSR